MRTYENNEYLTPHDIAADLGIAYPTVTMYLRDKKLNGFKVGISWLVNENDYKLFKTKYVQK